LNPNEHDFNPRIARSTTVYLRIDIFADRHRVSKSMNIQENRCFLVRLAT
jgi:hypothetical protein